MKQRIFEEAHCTKFDCPVSNVSRTFTLRSDSSESPESVSDQREGWVEHCAFAVSAGRLGKGAPESETTSFHEAYSLHPLETVAGMRWRGDLAAGWAAQLLRRRCIECRRDRVVHPLLLLVPFAKQMLSRHELIIVVPHLICATLSHTPLISGSKLLVSDSPSSFHLAGGSPPPSWVVNHPPSAVAGPRHLRLLAPLLLQRRPPSGCSLRSSLLPVRWRRFAAVPLPLDSLRPPSFPLVSDHPTKPFDGIFRNLSQRTTSSVVFRWTENESTKHKTHKLNT